MSKEARKYEKALALLPAKISRIEVQKKNAFRYSIFVSDQFLIGISEPTLIKLNIKKGVEITPSLFDRINEFESIQKIRDYLLGLLGRRDHSSKELIDKVAKKGYSREILKEIVREFEEKGFINNTSFAVKFSRDKVNLKNWGPNKIRSTLMEKGLKSNDIEQAIDEVFSEIDVQAQMKVLIEKKTVQLLRTEEQKRKEKIYRFLLSRGFNSSDVLSNMDSFLSLIKSAS